MAAVRVSVVIDNYNYGRFLGACVDSVLSQDFPAGDLECIVVDDGSTDESRAVLARYGSRIKAVLKPNEGQALTFNRGFAEATGEVVCCLDSDDVWLPGKVRRVVEAFEANPEAGVVQHYLREVDSSLNPLPQELPAWPERLTLEQFLAGGAIFTATTGLAYRKKYLDKVLPIPAELFYYLDDFLTVGVLFQAPGVNVSEVLGWHRIHGNNFCAEGYWNTRKLKTDFRMRVIFRECLDRWLAAYGKRLDPRYDRLESLELARREILYHMQEGRRVEAAAAWRRGLARAGFDRFGLFRMLTAGLALFSPRLYMSVYERYKRSNAAKTLRRRLLPA